MRSIPGVWLNESIPAERLKRIENWAESIPDISEVWAIDPRLTDGPSRGFGFDTDLDLGLRLADRPSAQELDQWVKAWSIILAAALKLRVRLRIVHEPTASADVLKAQLLQRTIFKRRA